VAMFRTLFSLLVLSVVASASIGAQNPQSAPATRAIAGTVLSESSQPIPDAEVLLLDSAGTVIRTTTTSEAGGFTLVLTVGQSYIIQIRKLGHQLHRWESGVVEAGKPMSMPFLMQRVAPVLDTVSVRGTKKGSALTRLSLSANEINPKRFYSAAGAVIRLRPMMLGDHIHECGVVREIYVNGVRRTPAPFAPRPSFGTQMQLDTARLRAKMTAEEFRTFMSLIGVLDDIRAGDVQEIRYANCWDRTVPIQLRDAIFVTLKPGAKLR
jgi:hypothetical protein